MIRRLSIAALALLFPVAAHAGVDCYAGAGVGKNISTVDTIVGDISLDGFQLGLRTGCDVSYFGPVVAGVWAGYDVADVEAGITDSDYASVGLRAGYKINAGTLAYGLIGIAAPDFAFGSGDRGTVYGAGLELDFSGLGMGNLIGFVEFQQIEWSAAAAPDTTNSIMVGAKVKLNVLK